MKRHTWVPLAISVVAAYIILDRRATRFAAEHNHVDAAADRTADWGSQQRIIGIGRGLVGRLKQELGRFAGNDDLAAEGVVDRVAGAVQDTSGKAAHGISETLRDLNH